MDWTERQNGRTHRLIALGIGLILLIIFTIFTLGMSGKSVNAMVWEVAHDSQFASAERFVVLPKGFGQNSEQGFSDKIRSYTDERVVCSASRKQFATLVDATGLKAETTTDKARSIQYVEVEQGTSATQVNEAFASDGGYEVKCKTVDSTRFFFFQTGPQLSSVEYRA